MAAEPPMRWAARLTAVLALLVSGLAPGLALAMPEETASPLLCQSPQMIAHTLAERYRETPVGNGTRFGKLNLQLYAAPSGRWTLVQTVGTDRACITALGDRPSELTLLTSGIPF